MPLAGASFSLEAVSVRGYGGLPFSVAWTGDIFNSREDTMLAVDLVANNTNLAPIMRLQNLFGYDEMSPSILYRPYGGSVDHLQVYLTPAPSNPALGSSGCYVVHNQTSSAQQALTEVHQSCSVSGCILLRNAQYNTTQFASILSHSLPSPSGYYFVSQAAPRSLVANCTYTVGFVNATGFNALHSSAFQAECARDLYIASTAVLLGGAATSILSIRASDGQVMASDVFDISDLQGMPSVTFRASNYLSVPSNVACKKVTAVSANETAFFIVMSCEDASGLYVPYLWTWASGSLSSVLPAGLDALNSSSPIEPGDIQLLFNPELMLVYSKPNALLTMGPGDTDATVWCTDCSCGNVWASDGQMLISWLNTTNMSNPFLFVNITCNGKSYAADIVDAYPTIATTAPPRCISATVTPTCASFLSFFNGTAAESFYIAPLNPPPPPPPRPISVGEPLPFPNPPAVGRIDHL